jgi:hypothetical protein
VTDHFRHDCQAGGPVRKNDDRAAFPQRADGEGGNRAIVAPMKEGTLIRLKPPTEAPRDSRRLGLCIRNEALYAGMFHRDMGSKPSLRPPRRQSLAIHHRNQKARVIAGRRLQRRRRIRFARLEPERREPKGVVRIGPVVIEPKCLNLNRVSCIVLMMVVRGSS